jgi:cytochrome P450
LLDLSSPDIRRNPFPAYDEARVAAPVVRDARTGFWLLFDYASVGQALTDHESFSSGMAAAGRTNPEWMIFLDPPRHGKLRGLISKAFTPKAVADLEVCIRGLSSQLLDGAAKNGSMDVVSDYATPLPMMVIAEMIGIPAADWGLFHGWSDGILRLSRTIVTADAGAVPAYAAVRREMALYLEAIIARRDVQTQDDLLTRLVHAEFEGERLTEQEIAGFIELLIVAGQETTSNLIANAILSFAEHPDQQAQLANAPELLPSAIEEVLRYRSPVQWLFRTTVRDVRLHGQTIAASSVVIPIIGAANRDPHVFAEPNRFLIRRSPNSHLAFGHGCHFCIGAPLARLEARIAIADLFARLTNWELAETEPWEPRAAIHVHGPARLEVRFQGCG